MSVVVNTSTIDVLVTGEDSHEVSVTTSTTSVTVDANVSLPLAHNHDDRYYTETEMDTALAGKAASVHTHVKADITDFAHTHLKTDITDFAHTHLQADITDLDAFKEDILIASQLLGSAIKAFGSFTNFLEATTTATLADGQVRFIPVVIRRATTVNGVMWRQATQGSYTADNNNKIGLYSFSAGTYTLVASCANDGNLWKGTSNTIQTKNFSSPYSAAAGIYFIAMIYNQSAQTTAPTIGMAPNPFNESTTLDYTNSVKLYSALNGQTDLPASTTGSSTLMLANRLAIALI